MSKNTRYDRFVGPRILTLYEASADIFGLNKNDWDHLRKNINPEQVKEFYRLIFNLWPTKMTVDDYLPPPNNNKLRALYIGQESPRSIQRKISRYSLYNDEIIVPLPFLNPRIMTEAYNPIFHPELYLENTLQSLAFLYQIGPWIQSGQVLPIPNPIDYTDSLRKYVFDLADEIDRDEVKDALEQESESFFEDNKSDLLGFYLRVPEKHRFGWLKQHFKNESDEEIRELEKAMLRMRKNDPYILDQDASETGELHIFKVGSTAEIGEYICHATGSYMYTDINYQWKKIQEMQVSQEDPDTWSALTQAFQGLSFKFLDQVDPKYASSLAAEGRLASFRNFLREVWQTSYKEKDPERLHKASLMFADRLTHEYQIAKKDWDSIDKDLLKWLGGSGGVGVVVSGLMNPVIPLGGFCASSIIQLVNSTKKRKNFKRTIPMAVFLDLNKTKPLNMKKPRSKRG